MHHHQFLLIFHEYQFLLDCPNLIGDGYCNDETNIQDCGYDGGDCCGSCINIDRCTNCSCLGNITGNGVPNALVGDGNCNNETNTVLCNYDGGDCCQNSELVGNGFCNDITNNQQCNYDGGDCCLSNVRTDYCTHCKCHQLETCATGFLPSSVGDGYCNDETNNIYCLYDGLDCCRSPVNATFCSDCICHGESIII